MKKMLVVAEYVENEEIREAVLSLGDRLYAGLSYW